MTKSPKDDTAQFLKDHPHPDAGVSLYALELHGEKVMMPYVHLEDVNAEHTKAWIEKQNAHSSDYIELDAEDEKRKQHLMDVSDYPKVSLPITKNGKSFEMYMDGTMQQHVCRVWEEGATEPRILINPNTIDEKGHTSLGAISPSNDGRYIAYQLSENGQDVSTLYVMDVQTGEVLPEKIEGRYEFDVHWDEDGKGFNYTLLNKSDHNRFSIYHHTMGEEVEKDKLQLDVNVPGSMAAEHPLYDENGKRSPNDYLTIRVGTQSDNGLYIRERGSDDAFNKLCDDGKSRFEPIAEVEGKLYMQTTQGAPMGRVVAVDLANPQPENWQTIIPEQKTDKLEDVFMHRGKLYVNKMHDAATAISVHELDGAHVHDVPLPPQVKADFAARDGNSADMTLRIMSFQEGSTIHTYHSDTNELELQRPSQAKFNLKDTIVERVEATSKDGTKVPMTIVRHKDTKLDGTAAVKMYGYGGFNTSLTPGFGLGTYDWVSRGGIYVQTNLRGGGEFGQEWNDGGKLENKQNVFDDFAACGQLLIDKGYTQPKRLTVEGGSNGGLLTLATALQNPDLFGAVLSDVPVADMLRHNGWPSDYGNPLQSKKDFDTCMAYSPVHNVKGDVEYPPMLVSTAEFDDRVHPSHAYKFVATMQGTSPQSPCFLHVERNSGHGAGKSQAKIIDELLRKHGFVERAIGPINQDKFKAAAAEWEKEDKSKGASERKWVDAVRAPANDHPRIKRSEGSELAR